MTGLLARILKEKDIPFTEYAPTAPLSTLRVGGNCRYLIKPRCQGELLTALACVRGAGLPFLIVGRGSNLLFEDGAWPVAVISTAQADAVRHLGEGRFLTDCGAMLPRLSYMAATLGYADLAFLGGVPGTVGGGVLMNAGAHGKSIGEVVKRVWALAYDTNQITTFFNNELAFSYRNSVQS